MSDKEMDLEVAGGWRPEPGDTVIGIVRSVDSGWSDWINGSYPILTIVPENGDDPVAVHCFQTTLKNAVLSKRPAVGSRVGIRFHGKKETQDGKREVAVYAFRVEGQSADPYQQFAEQKTPGQAVAQEEISGFQGVGPDDSIPF